MTEIIGFGTGSLYKFFNPSSKKSIEIIKQTGVNAIELCGTLSERFDKTRKNNFFRISKSNLKEFNYISLHAPDDLIYQNDHLTKELLNKIDELYKKLNLNLIIFHPNNIKELSVFKDYSFPIAFENLDKRKRKMILPEEFKNILKNKKFGLVLDLTHAYTLDATGQIAKQFIKEYKDKIKEIHCSGYFIHGGDEQQHFPACLEKQYYKKETNLPHKIILKNIIPDIPIIIESVLPTETTDILTTLKKELDLIKSFSNTKL